jgi:predicted nucleotidyltransferase
VTRDMTGLDLAELATVVADEPYPLVFATVSGAHLYGFPSRDSDVDLRGVHQLPLPELVGLRTGPDTVDRTWPRDGMEVDLVTHEVAKFLRLLLARNGYVLEQLLSPLVVTTSDPHRALIALAPRLVTRHHAHHYRGFATTQQRLFERTGELKPLLYTFRALLTGVHLMRTGRILANLPELLSAQGGPGYLRELIAAKRDGEHRLLADLAGAPEPATDVAALFGVLAQEQERTKLPDRTDVAAELHDLLLSARLG